MKSSNALCLFIKEPQQGKVKTRLQPDISPSESVLLYKAMVEDLVNRFRNHPDFDVRIYFWPPQSRESLRGWLGDDLEYRLQRGENLGEKMMSSFEDAFHHYYRRVVLVGSDMPTLEETVIEQALSYLQDDDLVLGPCEDGGYYLIGMSEPHPELFAGVSWSTDRVLKQTMIIADANHLSVRLLEKKADVDTSHDVRALWQRLNENHVDGYSGPLSKTYTVLQRLFRNTRDDA